MDGLLRALHGRCPAGRRDDEACRENRDERNQHENHDDPGRRWKEDPTHDEPAESVHDDGVNNERRPGQADRQNDRR